MPTTPRRIVTYELPATIFKSLQEEASVRGVASHHQRAREILVEHYANPEADEFRQRIDELGRDVAYLGELVRLTAYSVMVHAGDYPSDEANAWIRDHMPRTRD